MAEGYGVSELENGWYIITESTIAYVTNSEQLEKANNNSEIKQIVLCEGEFGLFVAKSNKTYIGTEGAKVDCINLYGAENVIIRNITFDAATAKLGYDGGSKAKQYANIITGDKNNNAIIGSRNLVIDGCVFEGTFANGGAAIAFTDHNRKSGGSGNVAIKNCTFNTTGGYYDIYGHYTGAGQNGYGDFVIEGNKFSTSFTQGGPIYLGRYASSTPVVVKGNTFETVTSIYDAIYVQAHSAEYSVSVDASGNTFAQ